MIQLYLIRHGEIAGDPHKRCTPPVCGCLSDRGVRQAAAMSEALEAVRFSAIYASPLGRAIQTAQALAGPRDLPIQVLDWLIEWQPATVLNKVDDANYEQMALAADRLRIEQSWKTPAGEGSLEITQRVILGFLQLAKDLGIHAGHGGYLLDAPDDQRAFAFVAHGGSLSVLLGFLLGLPVRPHGYFSFEQTGVAVVNFKRRVDVWYPTLTVPSPALAIGSE
jgi:broad specificity phosphatase PhoE